MHKKCVEKRNLEFENYEYCLEATQVENKINQLKNKIDVDSLTESFKEFIKNNKSILKSQQRFREKKHNKFNEDVSNIALRATNDKRMSISQFSRNICIWNKQRPIT